MKFLFILLIPAFVSAQNLVIQNPLRFLALGDSYTIGENVSSSERWPRQLSDSLLLRGIATQTLNIIATTGWRTDDLLNAITGKSLEKGNYNLVSLLIGVNNQYQAKPFSQYQSEFMQLVDSAIRYAGGKKERVVILSIPDYAYTPFGQQAANPSQISNEIDQYNIYNKHIADSLFISYINVTPVSRQGLINPSYVAGDGLHPSASQYAQWVNLILDNILQGILTSADILPNAETTDIYPVPVTDNLHLGELQGYTSYQLYDLRGQRLMIGSADKNDQVLDLSHLIPGVYTLILNKGQKQAIKKVVKL